MLYLSLSRLDHHERFGRGSDMILTVYILGAGFVMGYLIYKEETK
jgi:hypothetical protein